MYQIHIEKIAVDIEYSHILRGLKSFLSTDLARPGSTYG